MRSNNMFRNIRRGYFEYLAYSIVLIILFLLPLIFWDWGDIGQRRRIIGGWVRIFPFLIIFIVHNFWLLPYFLLNKKKLVLYVVSTLLLIVLINYLFIYNEFLHGVIFKFSHTQSPDGAFIPDAIEKFHGRGGPGRGGGHHYVPGRAYWRWHNPPYLIYTYNIIISLLVVGFNTAIKLTTVWFRNEQHSKELEKETLQSQLSVLQNQISPHFFMNTLNNIHALIDYNKDNAKEAILRLSKMMRYLLYDTEKGKTSLSKEIEFLESYIELMQLRLQKSVKLKINFPSEIPVLNIYPFLFIAFIENAFKYGIRPKGKSFIYILLEVTDSKLHFSVHNSKTTESKNADETGGIGIENTRKRLDLLFKSNYSLNVFDREDEFEIDLIIPIE